MSALIVPDVCSYCQEFTHKQGKGYCDLRMVARVYLDDACNLFIDDLTGERRPSKGGKIRTETEDMEANATGA